MADPKQMDIEWELNRVWRVQSRPHTWALVNIKNNYEREFSTRRGLLRAIDMHKITCPPKVRDALEALPERRAVDFSADRKEPTVVKVRGLEGRVGDIVFGENKEGQE